MAARLVAGQYAEVAVLGSRYIGAPAMKGIHGIFVEAGSSQGNIKTTGGPGAAGGQRQEQGTVAGERMRQRRLVPSREDRQPSG